MFRILTYNLNQPVTVAEVKAHCKIEHTVEDTYIPLLISAATEYIEKQININIMKHVGEEMLSYKGGAILLRGEYASSVTDIEYLSDEGEWTDSEIAIEDTHLVPNERRGHVLYIPDTGKEILGGKTIRVSYTAGMYATTEEVRPLHKWVILSLIGYMHIHRGLVDVAVLNRLTELIMPLVNHQVI